MYVAHAAEFFVLKQVHMIMIRSIVSNQHKSRFFARVPQQSAGEVTGQEEALADNQRKIQISFQATDLELPLLVIEFPGVNGRER